jgi:2,4-dienoyl-CoA reductase-like NADH-dependent reductase (Old Yellow Enzyme family)
VAQPTLFDPVRIAGLELRNRVVMAPMTRRFSPNGQPTPDVRAYYRRRAEGGVGAVITEGVAIDHPAALEYGDVPNFYGDALPLWAEIASDVQAAGAAFIPQLWHVGAARALSEAPPNPEAPVLSPSGTYLPGEKVGNPATENEIADVVAAYARTARAAKDIGADGIDIHGAHGFLIDQFLWAGTNERSDQYGGDFDRRLRLAVEVVRACRAATGPDFPIFFRFSQFKQVDYEIQLFPTPNELEAFVGPMADAGVDVFDCSQRRFWEPEFDGSDLNLAGWTKKLSGRLAMTVGSVGLDVDAAVSLGDGSAVARAVSLDRLDAMLARGDFDLVAVGRAILADPDWVEKVRSGKAAAEFAAFTRSQLSTLA